MGDRVRRYVFPGCGCRRVDGRGQRVSGRSGAGREGWVELGSLLLVSLRWLGGGGRVISHPLGFGVPAWVGGELWLACGEPRLGV